MINRSSAERHNGVDKQRDGGRRAQGARAQDKVMVSEHGVYPSNGCAFQRIGISVYVERENEIR